MSGGGRHYITSSRFHFYIIYTLIYYICIIYTCRPRVSYMSAFNFFSFKSYTRFVVTKRLLLRLRLLLNTRVRHVYLLYVLHIILLYMYTGITFHNNWVYTSWFIPTRVFSAFIGHFVNRFGYRTDDLVAVAVRFLAIATFVYMLYTQI